MLGNLSSGPSYGGGAVTSGLSTAELLGQVTLGLCVGGASEVAISECCPVCSLEDAASELCTTGSFDVALKLCMAEPSGHTLLELDGTELSTSVPMELCLIRSFPCVVPSPGWRKQERVVPIVFGEVSVGRLDDEEKERSRE